MFTKLVVKLIPINILPKSKIQFHSYNISPDDDNMNLFSAKAHGEKLF